MLTVVLVSVGLAVVGFVPLLGLPGAVWLIVAAPLVNLLFGPYAYEATEARLGPSTWGLALFVAVLWPLAIPLAFLLVRAVVATPPWAWRFTGPFLAVVFVLAAIVAVIAGAVVVIGNPPTTVDRYRAAVRNDDVRYVRKEPVPPFGGEDILYLAIGDNAENVALWIVEQRKDVRAFERKPGLASYANSDTPLQFAESRKLDRLVATLRQRGAER